MPKIRRYQGTDNPLVPLAVEAAAPVDGWQAERGGRPVRYVRRDDVVRGAGPTNAAVTPPVLVPQADRAWVTVARPPQRPDPEILFAPAVVVPAVVTGWEEAARPPTRVPRFLPPMTELVVPPAPPAAVVSWGWADDDPRPAARRVRRPGVDDPTLLPTPPAPRGWADEAVRRALVRAMRRPDPGEVLPPTAAAPSVPLLYPGWEVQRAVVNRLRRPVVDTTPQLLRPVALPPAAPPGGWDAEGAVRLRTRRPPAAEAVPRVLRPVTPPAGGAGEVFRSAVFGRVVR